MVDSFVDQPHAHVRDQGQAEHTEPHVAGGDHFQHGRHADQVGAKGTVGADLGGGLEGRPEQAGVDAFGDRCSGLFPEFRQPAAQPGIVGIRQVGKLRPPGGRQPAPERVEAGQVDVVGDGHDRAGRQVRTQRAGGVRDDQRAGAEQGAEPHQVDDLGRRVALVGVQPAAAVEHQPAVARPYEFGGHGVALDRLDVEGEQVGERPRPRRRLAEIQAQAGAGDEEGLRRRNSRLQPAPPALLEFGRETRVRAGILVSIHGVSRVARSMPGVRQTISRGVR